MGDYHTVLEKYGIRSNQIDSGKLADFIKDSSLIITPMSSLAFEALYFDKDVVILNVGEISAFVEAYEKPEYFFYIESLSLFEGAFSVFHHSTEVNAKMKNARENARAVFFANLELSPSDQIAKLVVEHTEKLKKFNY